ncbi:hypothetical protein Lfu02_01610 [Longispora fulva]|nr:hypothetical protein Lfu02_01610 [Longispora fulva]
MNQVSPTTVAKYDPLRDHLAGSRVAAEELLMTFEEIEGLVGPLPASARAHRAWWANDSKVQAQAWRAAGWRVRSVDQRAGRVVFARGPRGGAYRAARIAARGGDGKPELSSPRTLPVDADQGMSEEAAQSLLVAFLSRQGWRIERTANTATREHGVDVMASQGNRHLAVEVKGYPGRRYADAARAHKVKASTPSTQARHWYAQVLLATMLNRAKYPDHELAIALPSRPTYQSLVSRTWGSLARLDIAVLLVADDGDVVTFDPLRPDRIPTASGSGTEGRHQDSRRR